MMDRIAARTRDQRGTMEQNTLVSTVSNPIPGGAVSGYFRTPSGIRLRYAHWKPTGQKQIGTVCVFGGRGEFIEKYFEVVAELRRRGFAVACLDWRGQGGSQRLLRNSLKGHVENFAEYDEDLRLFMRNIVLPDCPPPYFALAHSTGGNILIRAACLGNCWFERILLTAPLICLARGVLPLSFESTYRLLSTFKGLGFSKAYLPRSNGNDAWEAAPFADNMLTSDYHRFQRTQTVLEEAPHLRLGSPTIGWFYAAMQSMAMMREDDFPSLVKVPILMIGAGSDRIVSTPAIEDLALRLKVGSYITIPNSRHEILQESDPLRLQFWSAFDAFIPGTHI